LAQPAQQLSQRRALHRRLGEERASPVVATSVGRVSADKHPGDDVALAPFQRSLIKTDHIFNFSENGSLIG
jgi:hypothetical protein